MVEATETVGTTEALPKATRPQEALDMEVVVATTAALGREAATSAHTTRAPQSTKKDDMSLLIHYFNLIS